MGQEKSACSACGEPTFASEKFCEACGQPLTAEAAAQVQQSTAAVTPTATEVPAESAPASEGSCSFCGEPINDEYCTACGAQRKVPARDHVEVELPGIAGVSDRGKRHTRNEDAMRVAVVPERQAVVAVVSDGMSTAQNSDIASQLACDAACAHLVAALQAGSDLEDLEEAMREAGAVAQAAVCSVAYNKEEAERNERRCAPAASFSAIVALAGKLVVGNIGDSRSYFVGRTSATQLSEDDSWAAEQVRNGRMTEPEAMAHKLAHSLMQWLGNDNEPVCRVKTVDVTEDGHALVVSDGFWNYAGAPAAVAAQLQKLPAEASALQIAGALTEFANDAGGHDNITVVVVPLLAAAKD